MSRIHPLPARGGPSREQNVRRAGVSALKANLRQILRAVDEFGEVIEVTHQGRVAARLVLPPPSAHRDANGAWTDLQALAAEIGARWPAGVSAAEAVADARRDL